MRGKAVLIALALVLAGCSSHKSATEPKPAARAPIDANIHKIRHVVVIMQENRSFDSYFGTYPGADGVPKGTCIPERRSGRECVRPFADHRDVNGGGPHGAVAAAADVHSGAMNGFVLQARGARR